MQSRRAAGTLHDIRRYERARMRDSRKPYCARRWSSASRRSATPRSSSTTGSRCSPRIRGSEGVGLLRELGALPPDPAGAGRGDPGRRCGVVLARASRPPQPGVAPAASATPGSCCPTTSGGRIAGDLARDGYRVEVLPDQTWVRISDRVRVLCIADEGQDAVLLVDVGGRLVVNLNDAQDRGWGSLVKRVIRAFPRSFLLRLSGYGDADMINFVDDDGVPGPEPGPAAHESGFEVGADVARMTETFGASHFVPFSSFHRYQRTDSVWANAWTTPVAEYAAGSDPIGSSSCPAFVRYDCTTDSWEAIDPPRRARRRVRARGVRRRLDRAARRATTSTRSRGTSRAIERLGASPRPHHVPRRWRGAPSSSSAVATTGRSVTFAVPRASLDACGRVGDLRRPPHRQLHADHAARSRGRAPGCTRASRPTSRSTPTTAARAPTTSCGRTSPSTGAASASPPGCAARSSSGPRTACGRGSPATPPLVPRPPSSSTRAPSVWLSCRSAPATRRAGTARRSAAAAA